MRGLSAREAAAYCGVSERTIRNWLAAGRLVAPKVGGAFAIPPADLDPFRRGSLASTALRVLDGVADTESELAAMRECAAILAPLLPSARARVAAWLHAKYGRED